MSNGGLSRRDVLARGLQLSLAGWASASVLSGCAASDPEPDWPQIIHQLNTKLAARDSTGFSALFTASSWGEQWFHNLSQFSAVTLALQEQRDHTATVVASWQIHEQEPAAEHRVQVTSSTGRIDSIDGDYLPIWTHETLEVHQDESYSLSTGEGVAADVWIDALTSARSDVRAECPSALATTINNPLTVLVANQTQSFASAMGVEARDYRDVAAVTWRDPPADTGPMRIYVNHPACANLAPIDRRVLLAHEATHVVTADSLPRAPHWLNEGLAERVGLSSSTGHRERNIELAREYARTASPSALPDAAAFEPGTGQNLATSYALANVAVDALFAEAGHTRAVNFCQEVGAGRAWPISQSTVTSWYKHRLDSL